MRAQVASALARVRAVQSEASDAACVTLYTELLVGLRALAVPATPAAAAGGVAVVDVFEAPVSTAGLSVSLDVGGVLATIGRMGVIEVRVAAGMSLCCLFFFCCIFLHRDAVCCSLCLFVCLFADR